MANINTPKFRVSYPNVHKPKLNKLSNKEEYNLVALFPKGANLKELEAAAEAAVVKKWGADKAKWPKKLRTPFRKQDEKAKEMNGKQVLPSGHEEGAIFLNLKSTQRPAVVEKTATGALQEVINPADFYAGCWAVASVNAYAYEAAGNCGVSFGLQNVLKVSEGDPLGGRTSAEEDFAAIEQTETKDAAGLFS